jgi:hypothetical protein
VTPAKGIREDYSFDTLMVISGIYPSQQVIAQVGGLHGKAKDIHLFAGGSD